MKSLLHASSAALALLLAACKADRPTEFVNVVFTISQDTSLFRTWDFDLESSEDFAIDWVDHDALRGHLLGSIEDVLTGLGYERVPGGADVDFRISYELWIEEVAAQASTGARARGSLVVRDGATGAFLWRATRKAPVSAHRPEEGMADRTRAFVDEMLKYLPKLSRAADE